LQKELEPIRNRRKDYAKNIDYVYQVLKDGSEVARQTAARTLSEMKAAMKINYFEDADFLNDWKNR
jgi:tryptophanyl-tRNA synthetase